MHGRPRPRRNIRERREHPFHCPNCGYGACSLKRVVSHIGLVHQYDPNFFITCNIDSCSCSFTKFHAYRVHLYRKHRPLMIYNHNHNNGDVGIQDIGQDVQAGDEEGYARNDIEEELGGQLHEEPQVNENLSRGEILQKHLALFRLKAREQHILPKVVVQDIFNNVRFLVSYINDSNGQNQANDMDENEGIHGIDNHAEAFAHIENDQSCNAAFDSIGSDFLLDKYCKSYLGLIEAQEYMLGEEILNGKKVKHSMQYVPILDVLKKIFR